MSDYQVHSVESAPEETREALQGAVKRFGFLPNLLGIMANTPPLLKAYLAVGAAFESTSLTPVEQQTVLLAVSHEHRCPY